MTRFVFAALLLFVGLVPDQAAAVNPNEMMEDKAMEARARDIGKGLRCLVCQNQSIDDSDATLARDLRILVRERLKAGDTNEAVIDYVVSRYGDFVLLRPPLKAATLVLWIAPAVLFLLGLFGVVRFYRGKGLREAPAPLSAEELRRLNELDSSK
jgi:cytochrome c-type biogenesis protein CcmH